jgi:hypothetical protein
MKMPWLSENALLLSDDLKVGIISLEILCDYLIQAAIDPRRSKIFRELMSEGGNEVVIVERQHLVDADESFQIYLITGSI